MLSLVGCFVLAASAGAVGVGDAKGPACVDIAGGNFNYNGSIVTGSLTIAAPACKAATYTLVVQSAVGGTTSTTSVIGTPFSGNTTTIQFNQAIADDDGTICVYVTSALGGHVFDRGPDPGATPSCIEISVTGGGGGGQQFS
jgi:hypothetical protein